MVLNLKAAKIVVPMRPDSLTLTSATRQRQDPKVGMGPDLPGILSGTWCPAWDQD